MSITSAADVQSALRQYVQFQKPTTGSTSTWRSGFASSVGIPAAGSFSVGNTANGIVPTDATAGYPNIQFGSGNGCISFAELTMGTIGRLFLFDRIFHAGSYAFNANTTLTSQPSYSARVLNSDYSGLQIWYEQATASTGTPSVAVTYTDQDGNAGATTGTIAMPSSLGAGSCMQLPLAAGDCGVQVIESVVGSIASAGTFNIFVARPLTLLCPKQINLMDSKNLEQLCMPQVYGDSALSFLVYNATTTPSLEFEIISK